MISQLIKYKFKHAQNGDSTVYQLPVEITNKLLLLFSNVYVIQNIKVIPMKGCHASLFYQSHIMLHMITYIVVTFEDDSSLSLRNFFFLRPNCKICDKTSNNHLS